MQRKPWEIIHLHDNTYEVPTFKITDEGIENGTPVKLVLCQGNKESQTPERIEGMFTETLLEVCKHYLTRVNVGDMATRETSTTITKIDEALMWLRKRAEDRMRRNVQGTYKP